MNFHTDEYIMKCLNEHYQEALQYFKPEQIFGIFLQGSQNYDLDYESSDIDTKLIVLPTLNDIIFNKKPISTTHVRENNEHIDFKDIRLYFQCFRKQNINFIEILFTKYYIINPMYQDLAEQLFRNNELIASYNKFLFYKSCYGMAQEKFHALEHPYPSKLNILEQWGYDPKQLHHLLRFVDFAQSHENGNSFAESLHSKNQEYLIQVKKGLHNLDEARILASNALEQIKNIVSKYPKESEANYSNPKVDEVLDDIQGKAIKRFLCYELKEGGAID